MIVLEIGRKSYRPEGKKEFGWRQSNGLERSLGEDAYQRTSSGMSDMEEYSLLPVIRGTPVSKTQLCPRLRIRCSVSRQPDRTPYKDPEIHKPVPPAGEEDAALALPKARDFRTVLSIPT